MSKSIVMDRELSRLLSLDFKPLEIGVTYSHVPTSMPDLYTVKNNRVLSFRKLALLFQNHKALTPADSTIPTSVAYKLYSQAWITPSEAVNTWAIIPEPYDIITVNNRLRIRHRYFDSLIPTAYDNRSAMRKALSHVLTGGIVSAAGDFNYRGQNYILQFCPDPNALPRFPDIDETALHRPELTHSILLDTAYEKGFPPLILATYERIKSMEMNWRQINSAIAEAVMLHQSECLSCIACVDLSELSHPNSSQSSIMHPGLQALLRHYPLLSTVPPFSLSIWLDDYYKQLPVMQNKSATSEWDFLLYLLGQRVRGYTMNAETAVNTGRYLAYALLTGKNTNDALKTSMDCHRYHCAILTLARRTAKIMHFLHHDNFT